MVLQQPMNNKCFLTQSSELKGRLDVPFYSVRHNLSSSVRLGGVVDIYGGKRLPAGETPLSTKSSFLYLRVIDIPSDGGNIQWNKLQCISKEAFNEIAVYELQDEDVLVSIAGTIGKVVFIKKIPRGKRVVLSENIAVLRLKSKLDLLFPSYLSILLKSDISQQQFNILKTLTTIPKLALSRLANVQIPVLPSMAQQLATIGQFESLQKKLVKAFEKEKISEENLRQKITSISYNKTNLQLSDKPFGLVDAKTVWGRRINISSLLHIAKNETEILEYAYLGNIVTMGRGDELRKEVMQSGRYPVVTAARTSQFTHTRYNRTGENITVSASGSYAGCVGYYPHAIFATRDCITLKAKDENKFRTEYIAYAMMAQQDLIYSRKHGAAQPHVGLDDLASLRIPSLSLAQQDQVILEIRSLRSKLNRIQTQIGDIKEKLHSILT